MGIPGMQRRRCRAVVEIDLAHVTLHQHRSKLDTGKSSCAQESSVHRTAASLTYSRGLTDGPTSLDEEDMVSGGATYR